VRGEYAFSQRRACGPVLLAVSSYRYRARRTDEPLRAKLVELARENGGQEGCGKDGSFAPLENASRFPLSHSHGDDGPFTNGAVSTLDVVG
jgi:hypothetical protein